MSPPSSAPLRELGCGGIYSLISSHSDDKSSACELSFAGGCRPRAPAALARRAGDAPPSRTRQGPSAGPRVVVPHSPSGHPLLAGASLAAPPAPPGGLPPGQRGAPPSPDTPGQRPRAVCPCTLSGVSDGSRQRSAPLVRRYDPSFGRIAVTAPPAALGKAALRASPNPSYVSDPDHRTIGDLENGSKAEPVPGRAVVVTRGPEQAQPYEAEGAVGLTP